MRVLLAVLLLWISFATSSPVPLTIHTSFGPIRGFQKGDVKIWRGVPFAAPPVGNRRFMPPVPPEPWLHTKETISLRPQCPQFSAGPFHLGNEDCLYLDVYVPANVTIEKPVPVMIWIYGGGYVVGDKNEFGLYDGTNLASKHGVIIVAMNYRLSALGFLALEELAAETSANTTGNYALQDQTLAMQWVHNNIEKFGGDLKRRTLFGESAGAFSVCWHLVSEASAGLFQAAIMESGTCDARSFFQSRENAVEWGQFFAESVGCFLPDPKKNIECLRALPTSKILGGHVLAKDWLREARYGGYIPPLYPVMPWGPAVDGSSAGLRDVPLNLIEKGTFNKVPLILGTNSNEGTIFIPMLPFLTKGVHLPLTRDSASKVLMHFFNSSIVEDIYLNYPIANYKSYDALAADVLRDFFFVCSGQRALKSIGDHGVATFMYHFTFDGKWIDFKNLGDFHASELKFVWDNDILNEHIFNENDKKMAAAMGTYWTSFAKTITTPGTGTTGLQWPIYNDTLKMSMVLELPPRVEVAKFEDICSFWNTVETS